MRSRAFLDFEASFKGPISSRSAFENFDLAALARLQGDEVTEAKEMLVHAIETRVDDPRCVRALAALGLGPETMDSLTLLLPTLSNSHTKLELARLLYESTQQPKAVSACLEVLRGSQGRPHIRASAIDNLAYFDEQEWNDEIDAALLVVLATDGDTTGCSTAQSALFERYGLTEFQTLRPGVASTIPIRVVSELASVRATAHEDLIELLPLSKSEAGYHPGTFGQGDADDRAARFRQSLRTQPEEGPIAVEEVSALSPEGQRCAEDLLLWKLGLRDPRVPQALADLGSKRAIPALEEVAELSWGACSEAAKQAVSTLRQGRSEVHL